MNQRVRENKNQIFNEKIEGEKNQILRLPSLRRNMQRGSSRLNTSIFLLSSSRLLTYSSSLAILRLSSEIDEVSLERLVTILEAHSFRSRPRSGAMIDASVSFLIDFCDLLGWFFALFFLFFLINYLFWIRSLLSSHRKSETETEEGDASNVYITVRETEETTGIYKWQRHVFFMLKPLKDWIFHCGGFGPCMCTLALDTECYCYGWWSFGIIFSKRYIFLLTLSIDNIYLYTLIIK